MGGSLQKVAVVMLAAVPLLLTDAQSYAFESTFTLDALSFVSFQNEKILLLAPGSTLKFNFGAPSSDGSIPFSIQPTDVSIAPIQLDDTRTLLYGLAGTATGWMRPSEDGRIVEMNAVIAATISPGAAEPFTYGMPFTTEKVVAQDLAGQLSIEITGMRLVEDVWYVQLVGATVNKANAYPKPGTAVYTVLSGTFDHLPDLPN